MTATARPWYSDDGDIITDNGALICRTIGSHFTQNTDHANAALIVRAVNNHEPLLSALKEVMEWIDNWDVSFTEDEEWQAAEAKIRAAIAAAEKV